MQDWKMEDNIWGKVRRWIMRDRKMRNKFGVKPEGGKCGTGKWRTRKWRTGNCRIKYLSGKCSNNAGNK